MEYQLEPPIIILNDTMLGFAQYCPTVRELPGRSDAEQALAAAFIGGRRSFSYAAVCLVPGALSLLEEGDLRAADDAVLNSFLDLHHRVSPDDRVYRWSATSLIVLMTGQPRDDAAIPASGFADGAWALFPLATFPTPDTLRSRADHFVASSPLV